MFPFPLLPQAGNKRFHTSTENSSKYFTLPIPPFTSNLLMLPIDEAQSNEPVACSNTYRFAVFNGNEILVSKIVSKL